MSIENIIEYQKKASCEEFGIQYVGPEEEGREQMLDAIEECRRKQYENQEARRKAEEEARRIQEEKDSAERKLNSRGLTARQLLDNWKTNTPLRFRDADLSKVGSSRQMSEILSGASALILGANGAGKTYTAYALAKEWNSLAHDCEVIKATEILGFIKSSADPFKSIRDNFGRSEKHLIIDEIDKIFESKADFVYLNYLIDHRYEWKLQTVVLGNGTKEDFIDHLGQSIYSRLTGDGGIGIMLNRSDRRKEKHD